MTRTTQIHQVRDWLGHVPETAHVTDEQCEEIARAWDTLAELHADLDPDDPDREAAATAAAQYVLGDMSLEDVRRDVLSARARLSAAMEALRGVAVAASQAGVSEVDIAEQTGVTRMTVRARLGK